MHYHNSSMETSSWIQCGPWVFKRKDIKPTKYISSLEMFFSSLVYWVDNWGNSPHVVNLKAIGGATSFTCVGPPLPLELSPKLLEMKKLVIFHICALDPPPLGKNFWIRACFIPWIVSSYSGLSGQARATEELSNPIPTDWNRQKDFCSLSF